MIKVGQDYSREDWKDEVSNEIYGIQKDVLKERFAPDLAHADFYLYESKDHTWVYAVTPIMDTSFWGVLSGGKRLKVLGRISKIEYDRI